MCSKQARILHNLYLVVAIYEVIYSCALKDEFDECGKYSQKYNKLTTSRAILLSLTVSHKCVLLVW